MFDQLKNLKQLAGLMGNPAELKEKFDAVQRELAARSVEAEAGAGAVRVTVSGKLEVLNIQLDPALITTLLDADSPRSDDHALIEQLIVTATNDAMKKAQALIRDEMSTAAGGLNLPGMDQFLT